MCRLAKASKQRAILFKAFANLDLTQISYAFLTLTHRNKPLNELRDSLSEMTRAWHKLSRRRTFPVTGFLRSIEVTMQLHRMPKDKKKNTGFPVRESDGQLMSHPHFHIRPLAKINRTGSGAHPTRKNNSCGMGRIARPIN
jgi:hypothetical protein